MDVVDFWARRMVALQNTWSAEAYGRIRLCRSQHVTLTRQLRSARAAHARACREAVAW